MDRLLGMLDPMLALLAGAALITLVALVAALRALRPRRSAVFDRLRNRLADPVAMRRKAGVGEAVARGLRPISRLAQPKGTTAVHLQRLMVQAGFRQDFVLPIFVAVKVILAVSLPFTFLTANHVLQLQHKYPMPVALILLAMGFLLPNLWLYTRVRARRKTISNSLPDGVDLLVTCLEAGLGLDAAISKVADEISLSAPLLSEELKTTFLEVQAGMARAEAFRRLADRTGVEDLRALSATLTQTELFGTSIANALRVQSEWIRTRRMQRAEERAATVAVKMTIPLIFFILPSLIAVIMGPAVVRIVTNLLGNL
ncbi:type II secretion system F family protein [Myxococcota bacterium]